MKVKLSIVERIAGIRLLNEGGDSLSLVGLKGALDSLEKLKIDEKEQKEINYNVTKPEDGQNPVVTWNPSAPEKEIEFSKEEVEVFNDLIDQKDKAKKFNMAEGAAIISLSEKLGKKK